MLYSSTFSFAISACIHMFFSQKLSPVSRLWQHVCYGLMESQIITMGETLANKKNIVSSFF